MFNNKFYFIIKLIFLFYLLLISRNITAQEEEKTTKVFSDALSSETCRAELPEGMNLFGRFIGSWEFVWTGYNDDGTKETVGSGEWIFSWILEGRAIQDVWILPGRINRGKPEWPEGEYGTTLRYFDSVIKKWRVIWLGPVTNKIRNFIAEKIGGEIVLTETNPQTALRKWIFSDITQNAFRWREEVSRDNGKSWQLRQEFYNKRIL